ncbi:MAG: hypothetical protein HYX68_11550 [Planctomycetes bacterium]|jgi:hypothetical protein|nr:hypothetical protein [Planctomycetota bacterium]
MIASFCLRLAAGLVLMLPLLTLAQVPPRFYRVHFLTALGLMAVAGLFFHEQGTPFWWLLFGGGVLGCVMGSIVWHLDEAPGGQATVFLVPVALAACLIYGGILQRGAGDSPQRIVDDVLSALVVGSAMTAMLMGHSYLISPAMSLAPLYGLLCAIAVAVLLRIGLACFGLWEWTATHSLASMDSDLLLWLPVRWILGLFAPLILAWMAWETVRIRSTQSATGILYVVVILCLIGELTSQLLVERTGFVL